MTKDVTLEGFPLDLPAEFHAALAAVAMEHDRARDRHGFTEEHDATRSDLDWGWLLLRRCSELMAPPSVVDHAPADRRRLLLEVAHIATSAIAAHDRRPVLDLPPEGANEVRVFDQAAEDDPLTTSTDDRWRYVTRQGSPDVERHVKGCRNWEHDCRGQCAAGLT